MVGLHHWFNGHEFGWTVGDGEGQGGLACLVHRVAKSWTQLGHQTTTAQTSLVPHLFKGISHQRHSPLLWNTTLRCSDALKALMHHQLLREVLMLQQAGDCPDVLWWWYPVKTENVFVRTYKILSGGLPWWLSGEDSACRCRRHSFDSWSGKIPHAEEQLSPWATATEPVL